MDHVDIQGGAAMKGLLTVRYAQESPDLHTELFMKVPFSEEDNMAQRQRCSFFADFDGADMLAQHFLLHLLPFKSPKLYFCDISRKTSNYILITERVMFSPKG